MRIRGRREALERVRMQLLSPCPHALELRRGRRSVRGARFDVLGQSEAMHRLCCLDLLALFVQFAVRRELPRVSQVMNRVAGVVDVFRVRPVELEFARFVYVLLHDALEMVLVSSV